MKNYEFLNKMVEKMEIIGVLFEKTINPDDFTKNDYIIMKMIMKVGETYYPYDMYDWNGDDEIFEGGVHKRSIFDVCKYYMKEFSLEAKSDIVGIDFIEFIAGCESFDEMKLKMQLRGIVV